MTATIAAPPGADLIGYARGVLDRARDYPWDEEDRETRKDIAGAVWFLADDLKAYGNLLHGIVPADDEFPGLEPGKAAFDGALAKIAADAKGSAETLVKVIGERCGPEAAASVSGTEGEISEQRLR